MSFKQTTSSTGDMNARRKWRIEEHPKEEVIGLWLTHLFVGTRHIFCPIILIISLKIKQWDFLDSVFYILSLAVEVLLWWTDQILFFGHSKYFENVNFHYAPCPLLALHWMKLYNILIKSQMFAGTHTNLLHSLLFEKFIFLLFLGNTYATLPVYFLSHPLVIWAMIWSSLAVSYPWRGETL